MRSLVALVLLLPSIASAQITADGWTLNNPNVTGYLEGTEGSAPAAPASGKVRFYAKSGTPGEFCSKDDAGVETCMSAGGGGGGGGAPVGASYLVETLDGTLTNEIAFGSAVANQCVTGVSAGAVTRAQPAFSWLTGSATDAQVPDTITIGSAASVTIDETEIQLGAADVVVGRDSLGAGAAEELSIGASLDISSFQLKRAALAGGDVTAPINSNVLTVVNVPASATVEIDGGEVTTGTVPGARGGLGTALPTCIGTDKLTSNGTVASCAADQTGGGGSGNAVQVLVDFGSTGSDITSTVVTGQTWVALTSRISCSPTMISTVSRIEGSEDAVIEGLTVATHSKVVGTGFTVTAAPAVGMAYGIFKIDCIGV